jgi:hypothetical protein
MEVKKEPNIQVLAIFRKKNNMKFNIYINDFKMFLKYVLSLFKLEKLLSAEVTLTGSVRLIASYVKIVG